MPIDYSKVTVTVFQVRKLLFHPNDDTQTVSYQRHSKQQALMTPAGWAGWIPAVAIHGVLTSEKRQIALGRLAVMVYRFLQNRRPESALADFSIEIEEFPFENGECLMLLEGHTRGAIGGPLGGYSLSEIWPKAEPLGERRETE